MHKVSYPYSCCLAWAPLLICRDFPAGVAAHFSATDVQSSSSPPTTNKAQRWKHRLCKQHSISSDNPTNFIVIAAVIFIIDTSRINRKGSSRQVLDSDRLFGGSVHAQSNPTVLASVPFHLRKTTMTTSTG